MYNIFHTSGSEMKKEFMIIATIIITDLINNKHPHKSGEMHLRVDDLLEELWHGLESQGEQSGRLPEVGRLGALG